MLTSGEELLFLRALHCPHRCYHLFSSPQLHAVTCTCLSQCCCCLCTHLVPIFVPIPFLPRLPKHLPVISFVACSSSGLPQFVEHCSLARPFALSYAPLRSPLPPHDLAYPVSSPKAKNRSTTFFKSKGRLGSAGRQTAELLS